MNSLAKPYNSQITKKVKAYDAIDKFLIAEFDTQGKAAEYFDAAVGTIVYCIKNKTKTNKTNHQNPVAFR